MKGMGIPEFVAEILLEQYVAFREGAPGSGRTAHTRDDNATTLAEFARTRSCPQFAPGFETRSSCFTRGLFCDRNENESIAQPFLVAPPSVCNLIISYSEAFP
jgi:hypothetical protein